MLMLLEPDLDTCLRFRAGQVEERECESHPVLARWRRARLDDANFVAADELALRRTRSAGVLARSALLEDIAAELRRRGCALLLADADGVIVSSMGTDILPEHVARAVSEGTRWSEGARGTNAIGVALAEDTAVAVMGRAHYDDGGHGLACYAAPIRGENGRVMGVLDATAPIDRADPLLGVTVQALAALLEAELTVWRLTSGPRPASPRIDPRIEPAPRATLVTGRGAPSGAAGGQTRGVAARDRASASPLGRDAARDVVVIGRAPDSQTSAASNDPFARIAGNDPALVDACERAALFAPSTLPVLLLAETGTGKELMAQAIHRSSDRARGPFVVVNCGAMPESLLASELFGYAPGAFTGARTDGTGGRIGAAQGGTLFLDEIAEMSPALQAMLLRVLEDGSYTRVGEPRERRSDFRLVSATCRDLRRLVREGSFRQDLYFRIQGVSLNLPALRDRKDVETLARELLAELAAEAGFTRGSVSAPSGVAARTAVGPSLDASAIDEIRRRSWPGNVRQLKMALQYALVASSGMGGSVVRAEHLPPEESLDAPTSPSSPRPAEPKRPAAELAPTVSDATITGDADDTARSSAKDPSASSTGGERSTNGPASRRDAEQDVLRRALGRAGGNMAQVARELGVARSTLYRMLRRHGLGAFTRD